MVDLLFFYGSEIVVIRLIENNIYFAKFHGQYVQLAPLEGLKFSETGILREFPDLKDKPFSEMKKIAIERLKEKLKTMNEREKIIYLKEDLEKYGYILRFIKREGWRPISYEAWLKQNGN